MNMNLLVKSHREVIFELFIATLVIRETLFYIFALLFSLFTVASRIRALAELPGNNEPKFVCEIPGGVFCCEKARPRPLLANCNQAHEQYNKLIKLKSGLALLNPMTSGIIVFFSFMDVFLERGARKENSRMTA